MGGGREGGADGKRGRRERGEQEGISWNSPSVSWKNPRLLLYMHVKETIGSLPYFTRGRVIFRDNYSRNDSVENISRKATRFFILFFFFYV